MGSAAATHEECSLTLLLTDAGISDASANVAQVLEYYPFGGMRIDQRSGSLNEQRRFTGHEFDTGTGLNYMDARYEGPTLSRFLSEDPNALGANCATRSFKSAVHKDY